MMYRIAAFLTNEYYQKYRCWPDAVPRGNEWVIDIGYIGEYGKTLNSIFYYKTRCHDTKDYYYAVDDQLVEKQ
jgi:hypothetical protein